MTLKARGNTSYRPDVVEKELAVNRLIPRALAGSLLAISIALVSLPVPAIAAGGGGGTRNSQPAKVEDAEYAAAVKAIRAEDYPSAIRLFQRVVARDSQNADAYNWLAYATRKNGDAAAAIPIYEKALAIDPKHRGAHEYIGEAYLMLGDLPKAKQHLKTLDGLCFFSCEEYRDLKKVVEVYEKSAGSVKPTSLRWRTLTVSGSSTAGESCGPWTTEDGPGGSLRSSTKAPPHRDDDVPRDGDAVLAGAGEGGPGHLAPIRK
jgi:hypothetical protein